MTLAFQGIFEEANFRGVSANAVSLVPTMKIMAEDSKRLRLTDLCGTR